MLKQKQFFLLILFFAMLLQVSYSYAANPEEDYFKQNIQEQGVDDLKWQEITSGLDYRRATEKRTPNYSSDNSRREPWDWPDFSKTTGTFIVGSILFILTLFIGFLLVKASMGDDSIFKKPRSKKIKTSKNLINIENIEEHVHESDVDSFITQAVKEKNYPLAVRLYYLAVIKELSLNKMIKWKKDKTNKDYIREMRKSDLFQPFRELTRIFERVWYGNNSINEYDFNALKSKFEKLVDDVKSVGMNSAKE